NFGDGTTSTVENPSHTYAAAGDYTVSLTALGPGGSNTATQANYIHVSAASTQPVAGTQSLFTTQTPAVPNVAGGPYELGMKFQIARAGTITAIRYWKSVSESGVHTGRIWSSTGTLLASVAFTGESASGWQTQQLPSALAVQANTTYVISVSTNTYYSVSVGAMSAAIANGDILSMVDGKKGGYGTRGSFPTKSYQNSKYFVDMVFTANQAGAPAKLALVSSVTSTLANTSTLPNTAVSYNATILDADGNTVTNATNTVTFSVTGVSGSFNLASPV